MNFNRLVEIAYALKPYKTTRNHHVSFVVRKGKIISIGQNSCKTTPKNLEFPKVNKDGLEISHWRGTCSEWNALRKINPGSKIILVNCRIDNAGNLNFSFPCPACLKLISFFDISTVYYTGRNGEFIRANLY